MGKEASVGSVETKGLNQGWNRLLLTAPSYTRVLSRSMKETVKDVSKVKQLILCRTCNKPLSFAHHRLGVLIPRGSLLLSQTPHPQTLSFPGPAEGFYKEDWTQSFKDYF